MMKKRILISILTLVFLVSTTGLPVTYHLCQMMEDMSLEECEMCITKMDFIETSCCSVETMEYPVTISSENPVCCQEEFFYNRVEDIFISSKVEIYQLELVDQKISIIQDCKISTNNLLSIKYNIFESPPSVQQEDLFIHNSILLI